LWFVSENNFETFRGFYCKLGVDLCDVDAFRAAEEGASLGLKPDLQGHTGFNLLKAQFWTPVQRNRVFKKGSESDPLEIKVVPPGGPVFRPLHVANLLKCSFKLKLKASFEADLEGLKAMEPLPTWWGEWAQWLGLCNPAQAFKEALDSTCLEPKRKRV